MRRFSRKRILIDRLQYRLAAASLIYILTALFVFSVVVFGPLVQELQSDTHYSAQKLELANILLYLHGRVWSGFLLLMLLLCLHSVIVSHRIAGPLYRLRKSFDSVTKGDLSHTAKLRKNDYLHREAEAFNEMLVSLRNRITELAKYSSEMTDVLPTIKSTTQRLSNQEIDGEFDKLFTSVEALKKRLDHFNIHPE